MKSIRLNTYLRQQILDSIVKEFCDNFFKKHKGFDSLSTLSTATQKERELVMNRLWLRRYKNLDLTTSVPRWALKEHTTFVVSVQGDSSKMISEKLYCEKLGQNLPCQAGADILLTDKAWEVAFRRFNKLEQLKQCYFLEKKSIMAEVSPLLDSFGSTKQLVECWPEVKKHIPANITDPSKGVNLPAINISRLQEKISGTNNANR